MQIIESVGICKVGGHENYAQAPVDGNLQLKCFGVHEKARVEGDVHCNSLAHYCTTCQACTSMGGWSIIVYLYLLLVQLN